MKKSESKPEKVQEPTRKTTSQIIKEISKEKDILEAIGDGISIQDRTFKIVFANKVHREAFGDNIGEYCYKVYQKREGICGGCPVALTFKDGKTHVVHREFDTDEGTRYVEITASPLKDATGKTIAGIEIVRDITERKQIEEALKLSEERYRSFVQKFKGIAYQSKMDWIPIFFHGNVEEITGYKEDEFVAGNPRWDQVILPMDFSNLFTEDEKKLHTIPNYSYEREYRIVRKDNNIRWVHEIIQNVCDKSGKPIQLQGTIYDITARKQAEKELQEKTKNLEELNTALKVLLQKRQEDKSQTEEKIMANMRELVQPYLEKLKKGEQDKTLKTYIDIIESNLEEIVSSFTVTLSSSHLNLTPTEIQVANLIKQGKRSKEIAELIHASPKTIAIHRGSIRKKLGLQHKKTNLRTHLLSTFNTYNK